jgi:malate synthase
MSNIGTNSNTVRVTGKYLDLLNDFIVKAKVNPEINDLKKEQLLSFFSKIADADNAQPQIQLVSSILERELRNDDLSADEFYVTVIQDINNNNIQSLIPKVERVADALDIENEAALAKINGD